MPNFCCTAFIGEAEVAEVVGEKGRDIGCVQCELPGDGCCAVGVEGKWRVAEKDDIVILMGWIVPVELLQGCVSF